MPATDPSLPPLLGALWLSTTQTASSSKRSRSLSPERAAPRRRATARPAPGTGQGDLFLEAEASTRAPSEAHGAQLANLATAVAPCAWQPQPEARPARDAAQLPSVPAARSSFAYSTEHFRDPVRRSCSAGSTRAFLYRGSAEQAAAPLDGPPSIVYHLLHLSPERAAAAHKHTRCPPAWGLHALIEVVVSRKQLLCPLAGPASCFYLRVLDKGRSIPP
ncbi:hypothetical protein CCMA1212_008719 [Trichoderma ghanense]|uniref:Uncharacterized protein n=1 Tax=Trichoderma ghanense TaxID=65468 RepID=A0ABY2GUP2_9HYPO